MINSKIDKIEYQTFVWKDLVRDETPSVLLETTLWLLERIPYASFKIIADGSATI